jgi:hypothetical protein
MSDSKSHSNRHKKKVVRQGLRELKNKPGWDVEAFRSGDPEQGLRDLDQKMRGHRVYGESQECAQCQAIRDDTGDETALCQLHLAEAMGLDE